MNNKKWLTAIVVVSILAIAFFWGGNYPKSSTMKHAEGNSEETKSTIKEIASSESPNVHEQDETSNQIDTKTNESLKSDKPEDADKVTATEKPTVKAEESDEAESKLPEKTTPPKVEDKATTKPTTKPAPSSEPVINDKEPDKAKKDKYLTDPVPEGKPKPVEWQDAKINKNEELTITLSVTAKTILDNMDQFNEDKLEVLPADGIIYKEQKVTFYEGESVFDVLLREMKKNKIHMEFEMTPIYNSNYIEGINNIYEFDCGELSGWMYKVNGWFPNYGSSRYVLKDGDVVAWVYTCDLGRDIGGDTAATGEGK